MVSQKYRWDFIGLSTDEKPTSETSDKVVNGSTYYCSDTSKLYVYCDGTWYERKPLGGGGGGGSSDFNDLSNRPKYNGSDMTGSTNIPEVKTYTAGSNVTISDQNVISATNTTYTAGSNVAISDQNVISATDTTYSPFTGTDGTAAGTAGLVPAPATTDAGKFLKADGTWDTAGGGGGGITELTSADYNWPTNNPDGVAAWNLTDGYYNSASTVKIYASSTRALSTSASKRLLISSTSSTKSIYSLSGNGYIEATVTFTDNASESGHYEYKNPTIVQTTGTSTTDVMSQNAVTSMVFADPGINYQVQIGSEANAASIQSIAIGRSASTQGTGAVALGKGTNAKALVSVAIGQDSTANFKGSVAIGQGSTANAVGEVNIGTSTTSYGYNSSNYRLLTGLYDPQTAHDAATKGYVDPTTDASAPTTATVGRLGQIQIDTTNADAYICVAVDTVTPSYTWKKITA